MTPLNNLSPEQRQEMLQKAKESRKIKAKWAQENLKQDYLDESHWRDLAKKHGYKLPVKNHQAGSKFVNRFLKHFDLSREWYQDVTGWVNGNEEARKNPTMPAFAQTGFLLEAYEEEMVWQI